MLEAVAVEGQVFDPSFFMYFEDVDVAWRAQLAGWTTRFVSQAVVQHRFQASSREHDDQFVPIHCALNRLRCLLKNGSVPLLLTTARRTGGDFRWLFHRLGGQTLRRWLQAAWDGIRQRAAVSRLASRSRADVEGAWVRPVTARRRLRRR